MKKLFVLLIFLITSCSTKDKLSITNENELFSVTKDNALVVCGGKSRLIENKNEEIIKVEIKNSSASGKEKLVQFTIVETDRKGANIESLIVTQIKILKNRKLKPSSLPTS